MLSVKEKPIVTALCLLLKVSCPGDRGFACDFLVVVPCLPQSVCHSALLHNFPRHPLSAEDQRDTGIINVVDMDRHTMHVQHASLWHKRLEQRQGHGLILMPFLVERSHGCMVYFTTSE